MKINRSEKLKDVTPDTNDSKTSDVTCSDVSKEHDCAHSDKCMCSGECDGSCNCGEGDDTCCEDAKCGDTCSDDGSVKSNPNVPYLNLPWGFLGMLSDDDLTSALCIQLQNFIWTLDTKYLLQMANIIITYSGEEWQNVVKRLENDYFLSDILSAKDGLKLSECVCSLIETILDNIDKLDVCLIRIITCYVVVNERPNNVDMYPFSSGD